MISINSSHIQKLKSDINTWIANPQNKFLILGLFGMLLLVYVVSPKNHSDPLPNSTASGPIETIDISIPEGHVLLPIEISNKSALGSLIGDFGIVDLMTVRTPIQPQSKKVGKSVRIIRSPQDPEQFSVVLKSDQVQKFLRYEGPYFAVIANPKQNTTTELEDEETKVKAVNSRIQSLQ